MARLPQSRSRHQCHRLLLFLWVLLVTAAAQPDADNEYVREILEENAADSDNPYDNPYSTEEEFQTFQQEQEQQAQQQQEQQRQREQDAAEQRARERDAAFEQELEALADDEARKQARKQKRRDAKVVQQLLRDAERGDCYAVLGLRARHSLSLRVPQWLRRWRSDWGQISVGDIKAAYRQRANRVHPDKNRDGRADQAFVALQGCFDVLSDSEQRDVFDRTWSDPASPERQSRHGQLHRVVTTAKAVAVKTVGVVHKVVGPFSVPVGILAVVFL